MTFSKALRRLTFGFSLAFAAVAALASPLTDYRDALKGAKSNADFAQLIEEAPEIVANDDGLRTFLIYSISDHARQLDRVEPNTPRPHDWRDVRDAFVNAIESRIAIESPSPSGGSLSDPKAEARKILESPIYIDRQEREGRNWLSNVADRLGERILAWLRGLIPNRGLNLNAPQAPLLQGLTILAWILIAAVVAVILFFVFRSFRAVGRKRRVGGILEDDEPERTADQWMAQAEKLEAEGKYREAVRCLYLACLVRYDDGRIARFRRHETNWEHLYRIEANPESPRDVDFRDLTQRFDKIWYGYRVNGIQDVAHFKEVYQRLCQALQIKTAA